MTLEFQVQTPVPPRSQRIWQAFQDRGALMTTADLARACIADGVFAQTEMDRHAFEWVQDSCRRALKERDRAGLPRAGQTNEIDDDGAPVWQTRMFWSEETYALNIREYVGQRDDNHVIAVKLAAECEVRHGVILSVPPLP